MVLLTFNWKKTKTEKEAHTTDLDNMANKKDFSTPNMPLNTQRDKNRRKREVIMLDEWLIITKRQFFCSGLITELIGNMPK